MVLPLIMKTEKNFIIRKNAKIYSSFTELQEKSVLLKISAQASEAGDFLNIFLRFRGF